jgi:F0F1-type ATP synthase delta subunit
MAGLISRYANDLLLYATEKNQLADYYTHALSLTENTDWISQTSIPDVLDAFLRAVPAEDVNAVLVQFIDLAREELGLLDVTVTSAAPLTDQQQEELRKKTGSQPA